MSLQKDHVFGLPPRRKKNRLDRIYSLEEKEVKYRFDKNE